jgi:hypothetical protein
MELTPYLRNLARELAESMDDTKSIIQYHKWVTQHSEAVLRKIQAYILSRADIKNRGAYFTSEVTRYAYKEYNSRD